MPVESEDPVEAAIAAATGNAALEGITVEADELDFIRRHQRGELTREQFLHLARQVAAAKAVRHDE